MDTSDNQCNEREHDTPSDLTSESQILIFFIQVELNNSVVTKEGEREEQEKTFETKQRSYFFAKENKIRFNWSLLRKKR